MARNSLQQQRKDLKKKLGRDFKGTIYQPGALKGQYKDAWYPGLEMDVMQGKVFDRDSARQAREIRQANQIGPDQPLEKRLTGKEKAFGTKDAMKMMLEGTPEQREYRRQMLGFLSPQEGQQGYLQNALQQLQQQVQPTQGEQQFENLYGQLTPYLAQQAQAFTRGAQYPSEFQNLPSPYSPEVQMGLPSAYGYQPQQQSDFQHLLGQGAQQYAPQIGAAIGQYAPQIGEFAQRYGQQFGQGNFSNLGGAASEIGSGMLGALRGLFQK